MDVRDLITILQTLPQDLPVEYVSADIVSPAGAVYVGWHNGKYCVLLDESYPKPQKADHD